MKTENLKLNVGWLYPDLMNTYGDRGNIIVLTKRCLWRNIKVNIVRITEEDKDELVKECDLLFMGGAQDRQQEIVNRDLQQKKGQFLKEAIEKGVPALFICGAYQFMGKYYKTADGTKIPGLGVFDLYTESPGLDHKRLIGNIVVSSNIKHQTANKLVGFENHGGRTYLSDKSQALAKVIKGYGNNGEDGTEGIHYKNAIGTYLHGPILPKNPELTDYLIKTALATKYQENIKLSSLNDSLAFSAREKMIDKFT